MQTSQRYWKITISYLIRHSASQERQIEVRLIVWVSQYFFFFFFFVGSIFFPVGSAWVRKFFNNVFREYRIFSARVKFVGIISVRVASLLGWTLCQFLDICGKHIFCKGSKFSCANWGLTFLCFSKYFAWFMLAHPFLQRQSKLLFVLFFYFYFTRNFSLC